MVSEIILNLVEELKVKLLISRICWAWVFLDQLIIVGKKWAVRRKKGIERKVGEQYRKHKFRYGYRKITALLTQIMTINYKVIQLVMQTFG